MNRVDIEEFPVLEDLSMAASIYFSFPLIPLKTSVTGSVLSTETVFGAIV